MSKKNWKQCVKQVAHYKALGIEEVYLDHDTKEFPWELVNRCEPGGSHRLDISTSIWFYADHECGLSFRWSYDIESREANGSESYQIKSSELTEIIAKIPTAARASLRSYFLDCAEKIRARGRSYHEAATRQFADAEVMEQLASTNEAARTK